MTPRTGPLGDSERDEAIRLLTYSFPDDAGVAQLAQQTPADRTFAVRDPFGLAAVVLWRTETVLHHGEPIEICIAGPGATHPRARRAGLLASAQRHFLDAMRDAGCALSGLETPITRWHQRNGWGVGSAVRRYRARPDALRPSSRATAGHPDFDAGPADRRVAWEHSATQRFGYLLRDENRWAEVERPVPGELRRDTATWREDDGSPTGCVHYSHRLSPDGSRIELTVHELHASTASAYLGLLGMLAEHTNVGLLHWDAPCDDPLLNVVSEAQGIEPASCVDKMLRVVDLAALTLPRRTTSNLGDGVVVGVTDYHAPWNDGLWQVVADGARHRFVRPADLSVTPICDLTADTLGPLVSGHLSARAASAAGLLVPRTGDAAVRLDALQTGWNAPHCPDTW